MMEEVLARALARRQDAQRWERCLGDVSPSQAKPRDGRLLCDSLGAG
jgi:hypothetical protein